MTTQVRTKIEVNGLGLNKEVASRLLEDAGLKADKKTIAQLVARAKDNHPKNDYLNKGELEVALKKLVADRRPDTKPNQPLSQVIASPPSSLSRYEFKLFDTDGNKSNDMLTIDPLPLKKQQTTSPSLRAMGSAKKKADQEVGHTWKGGITLQFKNGGELVPFKNGKWVTSSFSEMLIGRSDRAEALEKLKDDGYNINAQRNFLVVSIKDQKEPVILGLRGPGDKRAVFEDDALGGGSSKMATRPGGVGRPFMPTSNTDKRDYGFVSICTEVQVEHFGDKPVFTVKKPVIYLYPTEKTRVRVQVSVNGEFSATYPTSPDGTWEMIATPDGMLFDPKTEKRYAYLFWEGLNPGALAIDESRAFCVSNDDAETFLEDAAKKFALNDKERTDFVSYWLPALLKNPLSWVQFLDAKECEAYACLDVEPKPDTEIRLFMIFQRAPKMLKNKPAPLPELRRGKFTVVEWGGANLDE